MASVLPIIDFSPFLSLETTIEQKKATALEIDKACREQAREFFETATIEDKAQIALRNKAEGGDNARGYLFVKNEEKGSHEAVDFYRPVEANGPPYTTGMGVNQWPSKPDSFKSISDEYINKLESLGKSVMQAIALAMKIDESIFLDRIDKAFWNLRILGYEGHKSKTPNLAGIGDHTDFGILTFLLSDPTTNALQVLSKAGEWINADPIEGCYLCNIGDMLAEWTRGAYKSTLHRVLLNSESLRISVPFFFDPNWDAFIEPVLPVTDPSLKDDQYKGVRYMDKFIQSVERPLWRDPLVSPSEA